MRKKLNEYEPISRRHRRLHMLMVLQIVHPFLTAELFDAVLLNRLLLEQSFK